MSSIHSDASVGVRERSDALTFLAIWGCGDDGLDRAIDAALSYRAAGLRLGHTTDSYAGEHLALIATRERLESAERLAKARRARSVEGVERPPDQAASDDWSVKRGEQS